MIKGDDGCYYLVGVHSYEFDCNSGWPSVLTNIPSYKYWIENATP